MHPDYLACLLKPSYLPNTFKLTKKAYEFGLGEYGDFTKFIVYMKLQGGPANIWHTTDSSVIGNIQLPEGIKIPDALVRDTFGFYWAFWGEVR